MEYNQGLCMHVKLTPTCSEEPAHPLCPWFHCLAWYVPAFGGYMENPKILTLVTPLRDPVSGPNSGLEEYFQASLNDKAAAIRDSSQEAAAIW